MTTVKEIEEAVRLITAQERTVKRVERRAGMTADEILAAGRKRGASKEIGRWSADVGRGSSRSLPCVHQGPRRHRDTVA